MENNINPILATNSLSEEISKLENLIKIYNFRILKYPDNESLKEEREKLQVQLDIFNTIYLESLKII
jgi:hypothetical protein